MKQDIHPTYEVATVVCSCGNTFQTRATTSEIHVELCNQCHPFYTGKQKLVDSGGRVERYKQRFARGEEKRVAAEREAAERDAAKKAAQRAAKSTTKKRA